jgi:hypothetical protein
MEWRCEWCGKPHEENDPPCDNCGHGKFEKAVVRQTDLSETASEPALVWVCTECGREHPRNSPPCSRCGNLDLEKRRQEIDQSELTAPGYLDLLTPQYLAAAAVALGLVVVFVLGVTGIADIPGFGGSGVPAVEDVPGNGTHAGTVSLSAVEDRFTESLDDRLRDDGQNGIERSDDLDSVARYLNQKYVRAAYGAGSPDETDIQDIEIPDSVRRTAGDACGNGPPSYFSPVTVDGPAESADMLADQLTEEFLFRAVTTQIGGSQVGIDTHQAPNGAVLLLVVTC